MKIHDTTPIDYDDNIIEEIRKISSMISKNHVRRYEWTFKNKYRKLYDYIIEKTYKLNDYNPLFKNRLKWVVDKMQDIPLCPICGNEVDISKCKTSRPFKKYCSEECRDSDPKSRILNQEKYFKKTGYHHPSQNPKVVEEMKKRYREKYGCDFSTQNPEVQSKMKVAIRNKLGVDNPFKSKDILKRCKISIKRKKYEKMINNDKIKPLFTFDEFLKFNRDTDVLKWKCLICGNEFKGKLAHGINKISKTYSKCPYCYEYSNRSHEEDALATFIKTVSPYKVLLNRKILKSDKGHRYDKEIDIYIPKLKIGIEYDGLYYHSTKNKNKTYHYEKMLMAEKQGIKLIRIRSDYLKLNPLYYLEMLYEMVNGTFKISDYVDTTQRTIFFERDLINKCWSVEGYEFIGETGPMNMDGSEDNKHYDYYNSGFIFYRKIS